MKIIAVETSHDDTSVVLYENKKILKEYSFSQAGFHKQFGGTVPELASRKHLENLVLILDELLKNDLTNLHHVAFTDRPGLIGSLHMGRLFAQALAFSLNVEARPINHMFGHIFSVSFTQNILYPAVALIVSGGHTQLWHVKSLHDIDLIAETQDDAVGEVYDKIARTLKIGFPGGPPIDKLYDSNVISGEFNLKNHKGYALSFSGLKTKVQSYILRKQKEALKLNSFDLKYIATNFQFAVVKILIEKTQYAISNYNPKCIILGGGVSANSLLRQEFQKIHENALVPAMEFTTDNAMMIAIRSALLEENKK